MAYTPDPNDPFGGSEKVPSLSWRSLPVGTVFVLEILEPAKILHSRDFETNEPAYWDPLTKQQPKLSAVVKVKVLQGPHSVNEERSVWAQRPSNLYVAVVEAQKKAQAKLAPGGKLSLRFSGEVPHENPKMNAVKQYEARYEAPADGFYEAPARQEYAQPAQTARPAACQDIPPAQTAAGTNPGKPTW